jgi:hypothetical protein
MSAVSPAMSIAGTFMTATRLPAAEKERIIAEVIAMSQEYKDKVPSASRIEPAEVRRELKTGRVKWPRKGSGTESTSAARAVDANRGRAHARGCR